jgi:hypothetical protein
MFGLFIAGTLYGVAGDGGCFGDPYGNRTRASAVRGPRPNR